MSYLNVNEDIPGSSGSGDMGATSRDDQAKIAGRNFLYGQSDPLGYPIAPSLISEGGGGTVESGITFDVMGRGGRMTSVRRTFCLFVLFDLFLTFILWVIYTQLIGDTGYQAFEKQVYDYMFKTSLFDTVLLSAFRFTLLILAYALFRLRHWCVIALTTAVCSGFLIVKIFFFDFSGTKSSNNPLSYCLIIISFVLAWVETWFLDFKVLPQEKKMEDRLKLGAGRGYGSVGRYDGRYHRFNDDMQSVMTDDNQFYSPLGTPEGSDAEDDTERSDRNRVGTGGGSKASSSTINSNTIEENDYIRLARHCYEVLWSYIQSPEEEWKKETGEDEVVGIVHSKKIKGVGKVFRTKGVIEMNAKQLFYHLTSDPEGMPNWNPTMKEIKIIQKVDDIVDVIYTVSSELAGGVISSRDFVNVRYSGVKEGYYLGASMAVNHPDKPVQKQYVRGVNGAGGFVYKAHPDDPDKCNFTWFNNTDIKGWFPQKLIDANMAKVGLDFLQFIRAHAEILKGNDEEAALATTPSS